MALHEAASGFSRRLQQAMDAAGMKQADVIRVAAERGGKLGKSQMSQYVSGKTMPRRAVMELLASLLHVDAAWLASGAGSASAAKGEAPDAPVTATGPSSSKPASTRSGGRASARHEAASIPLPAQSRASFSDTRSTTMREFKKSSKLDNVLYDVRGPVADEAARMESEGLRILKLNIGNPAPFGFRTPDEVVQDMRQQLPDCEGYSDSRGLFSARKAIMQYAQIKGLPNVSMDGIYTGNGVSELIQLCMNVLLDTGDEVLIPSPDYPLWTACATLAGGTPVHYVCDEEAEWNPDLADIEAKITSNTKAIVIINPNNPTGAVYSRDVLEQIVEIARRHQLMIFSDEIYDRLCMDDYEHVSIASLAPDLPLRDVLGPLQVAHDRRLSHRLDDPLGQQTLHEGLHLRHQHALQHALVLQCACAVHCADGAWRAPERDGLRGAGRPCVRAAQLCVRGAERDSGHHGGKAARGVLHFPQDGCGEVQHPRRRAVRARPAA